MVKPWDDDRNGGRLRASVGAAAGGAEPLIDKRVCSCAAGLRLTIDLGALVRNWWRLAGIAAPAECAAVVKADAYGIGIEQAVPALAAAGCRTFFVALPGEGRRVRAVAPEAAIYVLNGFFAEAADFYHEARLRPVLGSPEDIAAWAAERSGHAAALHVDTGMNRLGLPFEQALTLVHSEALKDARLGLVMSHLACADEPNHPLNGEQLGRFRQLKASFSALPFSLANSAGTHLGPDYHFDLVRPGIALYGAACAPGIASEVVVTAEARILQIRDVPAGATIGYGAAQRLGRDTRAAILSAGYADGFLRAGGASDQRLGGAVWIAGREAPLIGRVSMDLMAADVTDIAAEDVHSRGWAELFGPNMRIERAAAAAGTIPYELLTGLSRRAHRNYVNAPEPA